MTMILTILIAFMMGFQFLLQSKMKTPIVDKISETRWFILVALFVIAYSSCKNLLISTLVAAALAHYCL